MNKIIILISLVVFITFVNGGMTVKRQLGNLREKSYQLKAKNDDIKQEIKSKVFLDRSAPVPLACAYILLINQIRTLESYSGTNMNVQLEDNKDTEDISAQYVDTPYKGVKGLMLRMVIDKFSKETDMGAVLDDIHLLEKNTDFMASEISKDNNNLIVKGEIYGL